MSEPLNFSPQDATTGLHLLARIQQLSIAQDFWSFDATVRTIVDDIGESLGFSRCWLLHLPRAHDGNTLVNEWEYHLNDIPATGTRSRVVPRRIDVSTERERVQRLVDEVARHCRSTGQPGLLYKKTSIADDDLVPWQSLLDRHADSAHLVPLRVASEKFDEPFDCVGVLIIEALSEPDLEILVTLANHLALLFDNHELNAQLKLLSELDPMTSLMTRRRFHAELTHELERAHFFADCFSLAYADIDHLKRTNDFVGRTAGDAIIIALAGLIRAGCRPIDSVARQGGNEFMVLMPRMDKRTAKDQIERIRADISRNPIPIPNCHPVEATASFGLCSFPEDGTDWNSLWRVAQDEVWLAKRAGRNRVGCHTKQSRDDRNRLHCADGPAAVFSDGYKIFSWHGTIVPEDVILHPEEITVERIDKETNIEIRRVLMDRYGLPRYLEDSGAEQIAEDELGVLLRKNVTGDEPIVMAKVLNATPEFDGTRKIYFLRVPPDIRTPRAAIAWSFAMEEKDYRPDLET